MSGFFEDKRFSRQGWQTTWDGKQSNYNFGDHLSEKHGRFRKQTVI